jgi:glucose 1-dehydrogenase
MNNWDEKVVLVTGASSGIGKAIALAFGKKGCKVLVNYRGDDDAASEVVRVIDESGGKAIAFKADVSNEVEVSQMFAAAVEQFGRLDILISNAGIEKSAPIREMTLHDWTAVIDVNLTGSFLCAREAARLFSKQGEKDDDGFTPSISFISSVHERIPWSYNANYAASKGGLSLLMQTLAQELASENIRVNSIAPGAIKTDINKDSWSVPEKRERLKRLIPINRIGTVEDVASAAVWLSSDKASYITGATLFIDGGMSLYPGFRDNG